MKFEIFTIYNLAYVKNKKVTLEMNKDNSNVMVRKRINLKQWEKEKKRNLNDTELKNVLTKLQKLKYVLTQKDEILPVESMKELFYGVFFYHVGHLNQAEILMLIDDVLDAYKNVECEPFVPLIQRENKIEIICQLISQRSSVYNSLPEELKKETAILLSYITQLPFYYNDLSNIEEYLTEDALLKILPYVWVNISVFKKFKPLLKKLLLNGEVKLYKNV